MYDRDNILLGGYVFKGYLIEIESTTLSGLLLAPTASLTDIESYGDSKQQTIGTIRYGSENVDCKIAFRYDVFRKNEVGDYKNRVLIDGRILWEVNKSEGASGNVIAVQKDGAWQCHGRHVVLKRVAKPPIFVSKWLVAPGTEDLTDPWEKDKFEIAWENQHEFPAGMKVGVDKRFVGDIQIEGELLFYVPQEYVLFKYND